MVVKKSYLKTKGNNGTIRVPLYAFNYNWQDMMPDEYTSLTYDMIGAKLGTRIDNNIPEHIYIEDTAGNAYYYYKNKISSPVSEESGEGTLYLTAYSLDKGMTYRKSMFSALMDGFNYNVYIRRGFRNRFISKIIDNELNTHYFSILEQDGLKRPLPLPYQPQISEQFMVGTQELMEKNNTKSTTKEAYLLNTEEGISADVFSTIKIYYKLYDGAGYTQDPEIVTFAERETVPEDNSKYRISGNFQMKIKGGKGYSQIEVYRIELQAHSKFRFANTAAIKFDLRQKSGDDENEVTNVTLVFNSSNNKFISGDFKLKSFTSVYDTIKYTFTSKTNITVSDPTAKPRKCFIDTNIFTKDEKNQYKYIICNKNIFNVNKGGGINANDKMISYFAIPMINNDYFVKDANGTTYNFTKEDYENAVSLAGPYTGTYDPDSQENHLNDIYLNDAGIVNKIGTTINPNFTTTGCQGYIAEQYVYYTYTDDSGLKQQGIKAVYVPIFSINYDKGISNSIAMSAFDFSGFDVTIGDENSEPYLFLGPQFNRYMLLFSNGKELELPIGNYNFFVEFETPIDVYCIISDGMNLILDDSNFNNFAQNNNLGDNFVIPYSNPIICMTEAFNNGYVNNPTAEATGRANYADQMKNFDIETNKLNRNQTLSQVGKGMSMAGDLLSAGGNVMTGNPMGAIKSVGDAAMGAVDMGASQQNFNDEMAIRNINQGMNLRNFENQYTSIRLSPSNIKQTSYYGNMLSYKADGFFLNHVMLSDYEKATVMEYIYQNGYTIENVGKIQDLDNRVAYNVIQLDTSYNGDLILNYLKSINSIFNTNENIIDFMMGMNELHIFEKQSSYEYHNNIENYIPGFSMIFLNETQQYIQPGGTINNNCTIYLNGIDVTSDARIISIDYRGGNIDDPGYIDIEGLNSNTFSISLDPSVPSDEQSGKIRFLITFVYGNIQYRTFSQGLNLSRYSISLETEDQTPGIVPYTGDGSKTVEVKGIPILLLDGYELYNGQYDGLNYLNGFAIQDIDSNTRLDIDTQFVSPTTLKIELSQNNNAMPSYANGIGTIRVSGLLYNPFLNEYLMTTADYPYEMIEPSADSLILQYTSNIYYIVNDVDFETSNPTLVDNLGRIASAVYSSTALPTGFFIDGSTGNIYGNISNLDNSIEVTVTATGKNSWQGISTNTTITLVPACYIATIDKTNHKIITSEDITAYSHTVEVGSFSGITNKDNEIYLPSGIADNIDNLMRFQHYVGGDNTYYPIIICEDNTKNLSNLHSIGNDCFSYTFARQFDLKSLASTFNLPQNLSSVGSDFAAGMFENCSSLSSLPSNFQLPQNLTSVGNNFAYATFYICPDLISLPSNFNLPQNLSSVGDSFASYMFYNCYDLTSLPSNFNLPQNLSSVGNYFAKNMLCGCTSLSSLPSNFNFPQTLSIVGTDFGSSMFENCGILSSLPSNFNFPQNLISIGNNFARDMFYRCSALGLSTASTLGNLAFTIPNNVAVNSSLGIGYVNGSNRTVYPWTFTNRKVGFNPAFEYGYISKLDSSTSQSIKNSDSSAYCHTSYSGNYNGYTQDNNEIKIPEGIPSTGLNNILAYQHCGFLDSVLPGTGICKDDLHNLSSITNAGNNFAYLMFRNNSSLHSIDQSFIFQNAAMNQVGNSFCEEMFSFCNFLSSLPSNFNLPQNLTSVGTSFAEFMFGYCVSLSSLPDNFNLPQNLTSVGDRFADKIFEGCSLLSALSLNFNFPQNLSSIGNYFGDAMFLSCINLSSLPSNFNFPQNISNAGVGFAYGMFSSCSNLSSLPSNFNLPQNLSSIGSSFAAYMFYDCSNLSSLPSNFNFPQNLTTVGINFARDMFYNCSNLGLSTASSPTSSSYFTIPSAVSATSSLGTGYVNGSNRTIYPSTFTDRKVGHK